MSSRANDAEHSNHKLFTEVEAGIRNLYAELSPEDFASFSRQFSDVLHPRRICSLSAAADDVNLELRNYNI